MMVVYVIWGPGCLKATLDAARGRQAGEANATNPSSFLSIARRGSLGGSHEVYQALVHGQLHLILDDNRPLRATPRPGCGLATPALTPSLPPFLPPFLPPSLPITNPPLPSLPPPLCSPHARCRTSRVYSR